MGRLRRIRRREFLGALGTGAVGSWLFPGCNAPTPERETRSKPADPQPLLGRQLFVDDYLIAHTDLARVFHRASYWEGNPVLQPDQSWEEAQEPSACAMPFSDGIAYDPADGLYKLWYMGGFRARHTCLSTSTDGRIWRKPDWGVVAGTNIVWPSDPVHGRDSQTVLRDPYDSTWPYKMSSSSSGRPGPADHWLLASRDGVHWTHLGDTPAPVGDRTTLFYNPFRKKWVFSVRAGGEVQGLPRHRLLQESDTFLPKEWSPSYWIGADALDPFQQGANGNPPQLYNLDCVAYESLMLGLFTVFRGDLNDRPKLNDICVGFSRDGLNWHRPDRRPFIGLGGAGSWNFGNVQSAGGCCVVLGDQLGFFVSGRAGIPGTAEHGRCSTGLALLRRDGFASMEGTGSLTTVPVLFSGSHLFVNAVADGELRVELLGLDDTVLIPSTACVPVTGDSTRHRVRFAAPADVGAHSERPVRVRFRLDRAKLFSFWVALGADGRSGGYLAAGGPGANSAGRDL